MAIKVVVVDSAQLPAGVDFPPLEAAKYGVELLTFPSAQCKESAEAEDLCSRISQAIDHYLRSFENKGVLP